MCVMPDSTASHAAPEPAQYDFSHSLQKLLQGKNGPEIIRVSPCTGLLHNPGMIYGYARVSTDSQSEAAQVRQLRAAGAEKVFREVASGSKTERPQLGRLLSQLAEATF
jgi:predicted site-specific integrase-resolvase